MEPTKLTKKSPLIAGVLSMFAVLALASFAFAGGMELHYAQLRAAPSTRAFPLQAGSFTLALDAPAGVDSTGSSGLQSWSVPISPKPTLGNPKIAALCEMGTASATATVKCGLYHLATDGTTYTFLGEAPAEALGATATATATAGASTVTDGAGVYPANAIVFDSRGATHYDVRVTTISTGNLTLKRWSYGSTSQ